MSVTKLASEKTGIVGFYRHKNFQRHSILQFGIAFLTMIELDEKYEFNFIVNRAEKESN